MLSENKNIFQSHVFFSLLTGHFHSSHARATDSQLNALAACIGEIAHNGCLKCIRDNRVHPQGAQDVIFMRLDLKNLGLLIQAVERDVSSGEIRNALRWVFFFLTFLFPHKTFSYQVLDHDGRPSLSSPQ